MDWVGVAGIVVVVVGSAWGFSLRTQRTQRDLQHGQRATNRTLRGVGRVVVRMRRELQRQAGRLDRIERHVCNGHADEACPAPPPGR